MLPQIDIEPSSACSTRKLGTVAFENAIDAEYGPSRHRAGGVPSGGGDSTEFEPATSASHVAAEKDIAYLFQKLQATEDEPEGSFNDSISNGSSAAGRFTANDELERFKHFQIILDSFAEACTVPVIVTDGEGHVRSINREALELFGYPRRDIVGKNVNMLMPKSIGAKHNYYLERYQATKIRHILADKQMGLRAVKQDGSSFPISLKVGELQHPGGGGSSFVAFIQDLSAQLEYERIENIFYSLLPKHIADRIRRGDTNIAEQTAASVIFIDCVGFTSYSATATPAEVVDLLTRIFKVADIAAKQYNVIKVKTIGDCWMGACFLQQGGQTKKARLEGHYLDAPVRAMEMVLDFIAYIEQNEKIQVRCGIATGSVLAGCMEGDKPSYDLIGSTVNLASRLQNCASPNGVAVDATTAEQVSHVFQFRDPSKLDLKGLGDTDIYVLEGRRENAATAATLGRHGDRE